MNLMDLYIKIGTKGLSDTKKEINSFSAYTVAAGNLMAKGIEKGAQALAGFVKSSITAFADYQQLEGGVNKLFGAEDAKTVIANAKQAYKTAGMSANKYMDTVTSISSKLISDLGGDTAKAADYADKAIRAMSDNANTFGTDVSLVQNAYAGFAKQNYTMLDNLKLGYGGTASEMARLINDSGVLGDTVTVTAGNVNRVSFDKIIEAIETVQTEMGITGTTFNEAEGTISGSIDAMKGSWENLKLEIASNGDVETALSEFGSSVSTVWENLKPAIINTITAIWTTADSYITNSKFGPYWIDLKNAIEKVIEIGKQFTDWVTSGSTSADIFLSVIVGLVAAFTGYKAVIGGIEIAQKAATAAQLLWNAAMNANPVGLVVAAIAALVAGIVVLWNTNEDFRNFFIEAWDKIKNAGVNSWNGIKNGWNDAKSWGKGIVDKIKSGMTEKWDSLKNWFKEKISGLFDFGSSGGSGGDWFKNLFNGSHADGLAYVPFDGYVAELHKGERVLTAKEAKAYNSGQGGGTNISIVINGANYSDERSLADAVSRALQNALDRRNAAYA